MKVSDSMYGETIRYVCEERLTTMLETEFLHLQDILPVKNREARFFSFCNTVESLNYHKTNQGQGWVGIRFQLNLEAKPNDVILHIKMHDNSHKAQQEAIGILGVNLVYACYFLSEDLNEFLNALVHRLPRDRMEIDMLRVSGPDFENVDNRILALNLVKRGITDATMFDLSGHVLQPATALYKKNILLMRGRFRPVTKVHIDMVESGKKQFLKDKDVSEDNLSVIFELTLKDLTADGKISDKDFNTKQIKELGEDEIEKLNNALISNSIFDKVSNKDEILNCLTFKTDEKGKPILDKNNKKVLINGNCTLSYLARGISLG